MALAAALFAGAVSIELPDPLAHRGSRARTVRDAVFAESNHHHPPETPVAVPFVGVPLLAGLVLVGRVGIVAQAAPRHFRILPGHSRAPPAFS